MDRRLALAGASLVMALSLASCRPVDGGAGGSPSPRPSGVESSDSPAPSADAEATPTATIGSDYGY